MWQLSAQRDLPAALVMTASYLGTKGTHGMQEFLPNTYAPGATNPCPLCPLGFVYRTSGGNSTREAATLQLRRRLRSGLTASVSYTYAKAVDDDAQVGAQGHITASSAASASSGSSSGQSTGSPTIAQNWLNLRGERGLSTFDQRHALAAQLQYTTGMGMGGGTLLTGWRGRAFKEWTVQTRISAASGLPETPIYLEAVPGTGFTGTIRPNLTGAQVRQSSGGTFLNAAAYTAPVAGQWGTAGRDSITGDVYKRQPLLALRSAGAQGCLQSRDHAPHRRRADPDSSPAVSRSELLPRIPTDAQPRCHHGLRVGTGHGGAWR